MFCHNEVARDKVLFILHDLCHNYWSHGITRNQTFVNHGIDLVIPQYSGFSTRLTNYYLQHFMRNGFFPGLIKSMMLYGVPDCKVHWANMGPTWVLSAPDWPHVGPMNLAIRGHLESMTQQGHFIMFMSHHCYSMVTTHASDDWYITWLSARLQ